jgi:hypothetical protein
MIGSIPLVIGGLPIELLAYLCRFWHFWESIGVIGRFGG